jgi:hypothetical protein
LKCSRSPITTFRVDPDSEGASGLGLGHSSFYGIHDLPTEVFGIGFHQSMMPCSPSSSQHAVEGNLSRLVTK